MIRTTKTSHTSSTLSICRLLCLSVIVTMLTTMASCKRSQFEDCPEDIYATWMDSIGARPFPIPQRLVNVDSHGAKGDGTTLSTQYIQAAIDSVEALGGGTVTFSPGTYVTGSIFIGNNTRLNIPRETTIKGSTDINDYKLIPTRVAGIEMEWPAAIINAINKQNVVIYGGGTIDGNGKVFWENYFKMRKEYNKRSLRWIVDYDCKRPRGILISQCHDTQVNGITMLRTGFWGLHVLYSHHITVANTIINNNIDMRGPSTDGIDIDSSWDILVDNCIIDCNDDNICLKAGRDADGQRVNLPCEYVVIRNCTAMNGEGLITCGSETSGSIRHVIAYNLKATGTLHGIRFKSTSQRGGTVEDIHISNVEMDSVKRPLFIDLNWHPDYNSTILPDDISPDTIPQHWQTLLLPVEPSRGLPKFRDIHFQNIQAHNADICIKVNGFEGSTIDSLTFANVHLHGNEYGEIRNDHNWNTEGLHITTTDNL